MRGTLSWAHDLAKRKSGETGFLATSAKRGWAGHHVMLLI
jgi:hypothetical protein